MKTKFVVNFLAVIWSVTSYSQSNVSPVGDFIRDQSGKPLSGLPLISAYLRCKERGMRLPTIREIALDSEINDGGKMLEEIDFINNNIPTGYAKEMFRRVNYVNYEGKKAAFYFSAEKYMRYNERGFYWVWTSSVAPYPYAYSVKVFEGEYGEFSHLWEESENKKLAVRCVKF